ncbi:uncharacterized protein CEXT_667931 [Caerostris extrusa]|uniref:Uncharacterized protein n=1 Tax=Caerostris extrusa TaxID=172846 RepID=A0AAV4SLF0_CAEEX|nr:uncharacterized protein CEXT_667931 [Caerostris extrusa]
MCLNAKLYLTKANATLGIRWMCLSVHRPHMKEYPPLCTQVEPYLLPLAEEDEDEDKILKFELDTVDGSSSVNRDVSPSLSDVLK